GWASAAARARTIRAGDIPPWPAGPESRRVSTLLLLPARRPGRQLDAERSAGLARPAAHGLALQARVPRDAAVLAGAALLHRERRRRGPPAEAPRAGRDPDDARVPGALARLASVDGPRRVLARRRAGAGARLRQRRRSAGAPVVRDGAGGTRRRLERRRAQLGRIQPGPHRGAG